MKYSILIFVLMLMSCSTSQFTMYKPSNETQGWKIEVEKLSNTFTLKIDGVQVIEQSYNFLGSQFEASGSYKGKKVQISGYRTMSQGFNGVMITHDQVRVIIDDTEVTKFDFNS